METRERRIVTAITTFFEREEVDPQRVDARAHSLPAMLRRHGPARTLLFLASKSEGQGETNGNGDDGKLARCLIKGIEAATGDPPSNLSPRRFGERLATDTDMPKYLLEWEAAIETCGWIKMLVEARKGDPANAPEEG